MTCFPRRSGIEWRMGSAPEEPPTMRELARVLGFSASTVSLALRNDPRVAAATRRKVQQAARKHGYHLNPALTRMMGRVRRSERARYRETLAWLNLGESPDRFGPTGLEYLRQMWEAASLRAGTFGCLIEQFWVTEPGMTGRRLSAILSSRGIRGILIPPLPRSWGHLSIRWADFAAVALTYTVPRPLVHRIVPSHFANMQEILRTIHRRGFRRPGLLLPRRYDERTGNRFRSAFLFHQNTLPARSRVPVHVCGSQTLDASCRKWLLRHQPDVVITLGGLRHLDTLGLPPPAVILIGYAQTDAGFAAMDENAPQIGATAVDHLLGMLGRNERGIPECPQTVLIPGRWIEGASLPERNPAL